MITHKIVPLMLVLLVSATAIFAESMTSKNNRTINIVDHAIVLTTADTGQQSQQIQFEELNKLVQQMEKEAPGSTEASCQNATINIVDHAIILTSAEHKKEATEKEAEAPSLSDAFKS